MDGVVVREAGGVDGVVVRDGGGRVVEGAVCGVVDTGDADGVVVRGATRSRDAARDPYMIGRSLGVFVLGADPEIVRGGAIVTSSRTTGVVVRDSGGADGTGVRGTARSVVATRGIDGAVVWRGGDFVPLAVRGVGAGASPSNVA